VTLATDDLDHTSESVSDRILLSCTSPPRQSTATVTRQRQPTPLNAGLCRSVVGLRVSDESFSSFKPSVK